MIFNISHVCETPTKGVPSLPSCYATTQSILGGLLPLLTPLALRLATSLPLVGGKGLRLRLLILASFLNPYMILKISTRPFFAFTSDWPILMLISRPVGVVKSLLRSKCFMMTHTNTPQSLLFSCCGLSSRSWRWMWRPSKVEILSHTMRAGSMLAE